MRRAGILLAGALAFAASPLSAGKAGQAVSDTIYATAQRDCMQNMMLDAVACAQVALDTFNEVSTKYAPTFWTLCGPTSLTMACLALKYLTDGLKLTKNGGSGWAGGGATGTWNDECDFAIEFDAAGNLLIPALAAGSGPLMIGTDYWKHTSSQGDRWSAHMLGGGSYQAHRFNIATRDTTTDKRYYYGIGFFKPGTSGTTGWRACSTAHYETNGTYRPSGCIWLPTTAGTAWGIAGTGLTQAGYRPCPEGGTASGDVYYYTAGGSGPCTAYVPMSEGAPGVYKGFALNAKFPVPFSEYSTGTLGSQYPHVGGCKVANGIIKRMAQLLIDKAGKPLTVTDEDVKNGPEGEPTIDDMSKETVLPPPSAPGESTDAPGDGPVPEPTPTPTPTNGPDYTHVPVAANDPTAPDIDWWPDLPSVSLSLGNPQCPTYDMSVPQFGWVATLDSHCPLIESNRALIGTIMILMFSVGSILIVLRA